MSSLSLGRTPRRGCLIGITVAPLVATTVPVAIATPPECQTRWLDGVPTSDISYSGSYFSGVRALTMWDPDGDGPEPERLVAGGAFDTIGGIGSPQVAAWVPGDRTFTALGQGFTAPATSGAYVTAVATAPRADGGQDLYAAGKIVVSGGMAVNGIARWDGSNWRPLGSGLGPIPPAFINVTYVMVGCPNGSLVVAGTFTSAGGLPATGLAQWDGANWSIPATVAGGVSAVACLPDNSLIIGGNFTSVSGEPIVRVARIQSGVPTPMGGEQIGNVSSLAVTPNGTVYATSDAPTMRIWRWDDGTWTQIGSATTTQYTWDLGAAKVISLSDDTVALAGYFTSLNGEAFTNLARFDGASWAQIGSPESSDAAVQLPGGRIVTARTNLQVSEEQSTSALLGQVPQLTNGTAYAVEYFEGDLVAAGIFTSIQGVPVTNVARRTAEGWQQMGSLQGVTDLFNRDGTLYAAGWFEGHVARWTGEQWVIDMPAPAESTLPGFKYYHLSEHNGTLVLSYHDGFSRFLLQHDTGWEVLPSILTNRISAQAVSAEGRLFVADTWANVLKMLDGSRWIDIYSGEALANASAIASHEGRLFACLRTAGEPLGSRKAWTLGYKNGDVFESVGFVRDAIRRFQSSANGDLYGIADTSMVYRYRDGVLAPVIGGIGNSQDYGEHSSSLATDDSGRVAVIRYRYPSGNTFAEFLDPRPVALRDVPAEMLVCDDGRAEVSVRVLGTLDRTQHWEWDGGGEFAPIADGFAAGLGIVGGSASDALFLDQADIAAFGSHVRLVASDACNAATSAAIMLVPGASDTYACARCSSCPNDYNQDGSTDGADLAAFFADFELGLPCADMDRDGGVSGADIGAFFAAFETGAC